MEQVELDVDIRLQRETNKKIEQQLISLCLAMGDDNVIRTFEQLSADQGFKIILKPSSIPHSNKQQDKVKKTSSSNINLIPNIVNISIDSSSRSTTSESSRSSKKSA
jgi:hypothetical protein